MKLDPIVVECVFAVEGPQCNGAKEKKDGVLKFFLSCSLASVMSGNVVRYHLTYRNDVPSPLDSPSILI